MGIIDKLKGVLPPSSKSFHAMYGSFNDMNNDLTWRIHEMQERVERIDEKLAAHDAHMKLLAWELYRKEGESSEDAKKRFFHALPEASGGLRVMQLGCAQLLHEFDAFCAENGLQYWIAFGTLLGAVRHGGFVPWDDDVDLGMMRGDIEKLMNLVDGSDRYRASVVFDRFSMCRQVRFCYADESVPCFLDLFIYDYSKLPGHEAFAAMGADRKRLFADVDGDADLGFWQGDGAYVDARDPRCSVVARHFDDVVEAEYGPGGYLTYDEAEARSVIWSVDDMDDDYTRDWCYVPEDIFPCERISFENFEFSAPRNTVRFLSEVYGDFYELPNDILSHYRHVDVSELE